MASSVVAMVLSLLKDLLCTCVFSLLSSISLSLSRCFSHASHASDGHGQAFLYKGTVFHERLRPIRHSFRYSARYAFVSLDNPPPWFSTSSAAHHMSAPEARTFANTQGPVYLLTVPTSVGYEQNPLSVYYCYDDHGYDDGSLVKCIAEVTNTPWAERVTFIFDPNADTVAKPLHVSPFMDMAGTWCLHAPSPNNKLILKVGLQHPELGNYFTAVLHAKRVDDPMPEPETFFWLMPHKVALGIYWEALRLRWKGLPFLQHPKYVAGNEYRTCAMQQDQKLRGLASQHECQASSQSSYEETPISPPQKTIASQRLFFWREANWPWA